MHNFTPLTAVAGGALIGLAATLLLWTSGQVAGISGVLGALLTRSAVHRGVRALFLAGLGAAGLLAVVLAPERIGAPVVSTGLVAVAGLLVGFGTRLGGGCTSGHGVCGLSRGSWRALAGTLVFMATGAATVFVVRHVAAGAP